MSIIVRDIDKLWTANDGFIDKQRSWLAQMKTTQCLAAEMKQYFHQWCPLSAYVRAGNRAGKNSFSFSLRFSGQEVARLVVQGRDVWLRISEKTARTNIQYFHGIKLTTGKYKWSSNEALEFRKHFQTLKKNNAVELHSPEHSIESRIIKEMLSKSRNKFGGTFSGVQPVTLSGFPLQFPLPISGSSGAPKATNGHIDILARRRHAGRVCLSVWELKAPGKYKNTLREVYIYAVTLLKMLRDPELGQEWYRVFGFSGAIPTVLSIDGVVAITRDQERKLKREVESYDLQRQIRNDRIEFYVAYYDEDALKIDFEKL